MFARRDSAGEREIMSVLAAALPATSSISVDVWYALVAAFSAGSSLLAVVSGLCAWIARENGLKTPQVADAAGLGLAIAFPASVLAGGYAYLEVWLSGLTST